ncbi:MAG: YggT family protein [Candidatus Dormibacteria bacterium]
MSHELGRILSAVIQVVIYLIIARAIGSFFVKDWSRGLPRFLWDVTEPILAPARRIIPPMGGLDFSPLVLIIGLQLLNGFLAGI